MLDLSIFIVFRRLLMGRMEMIPGRILNIAFLMLVIRLADGQKMHLGARRPGGGMTQSIMQSNLKVSFGKNGKKA